MTLDCELVKDVNLVCELETGGAEAKTQSKTVTPTASPQTVYPDSGYYLSSVNLTEPLSQEKTVTPSDTAQDVVPDEDYLLKKVTVEAAPEPLTQSKTVVSAVNQQTVTPDEGYLLSSVTVDGMPTETASVTPTEQTQTVTPSEGKLLSEVTVEPIPSQYRDTSDATATAEDINLGKTAYGANGEIVGTNTYVKPVKGIIYEDYDQYGVPSTIRVVGYTDDMPTSLIRARYLWNNGTRGRVTKLITEPSISVLKDTAFNYNQQFVTFEFLGQIDKIGQNACSNCSHVTTVIFHSQVNNIYSDAFGANNATMLYDFSNCTYIPELYLGSQTIPAAAARDFGHASGCVFRVKQNLLEEWRDLWQLSDTVWEGV